MCYRTSGSIRSGYSQTLSPLDCVWGQDLHTNDPFSGLINEHRSDTGYQSLSVQKEGEAPNTFKCRCSDATDLEARDISKPFSELTRIKPYGTFKTLISSCSVQSIFLIFFNSIFVSYITVAQIVEI